MSKHIEVCKDEIIKGKYYYTIEMGRSCNSQQQILGHLNQHIPCLERVHSVDECDFILVFCIISSRAGTDISAALKKLDDSSASKPAIIIVLYHTLDEDKIILESSRFINRRNTLSVDCLFHEDIGLLKCKFNEKALDKILTRFEHQQPFWTSIKRHLQNFLTRRPLIIITAIFGVALLYRWYGNGVEQKK